ncbi:MAG TPA: DUF4013 domain-containing protein [Anaerolineae bacterium]|nr:DUF4013 domain-containing protein [Anaerolineae bacterium]HOR00602.1 DUF4013 domain-containing protein [Anaerolineae bacterium]HOR00603.1 DUF4013 domain-containing protein [Anaerolineae bacterium]
MPQTPLAATLQDAFRFPLEGEAWKARFLTGSGLIFAGMFIPILPLVFVFGYVVAVMRRIVRGEAPAMPAWDDWGRLGSDGLGATLAGLVCLLPGLLVFLGGMALYFGASLAMPFVASGSGDSPGVILGFTAFLLAAMAILFISIAVATLLFAAGAIPLPVAVAHQAARGRVGAALRVGEWWRILRANKMGFFIAWVVVIGLLTILYSGVVVLGYSVVLACLAPFLAAPASFYLLLVAGAVFAQSYREGAEALLQGTVAQPATGETSEGLAEGSVEGS